MLHIQLSDANSSLEDFAQKLDAANELFSAEQLKVQELTVQINGHIANANANELIGRLELQSSAADEELERVRSTCLEQKTQFEAQFSTMQDVIAGLNVEKDSLTTVLAASEEQVFAKKMLNKWCI